MVFQNNTYELYWPFTVQIEIHIGLNLKIANISSESKIAIFANISSRNKFPLYGMIFFGIQFLFK